MHTSQRVDQGCGNFSPCRLYRTS